jgi:hypothetical protein
LPASLTLSLTITRGLNPPFYCNDSGELGLLLHLSFDSLPGFNRRELIVSSPDIHLGKQRSARVFLVFALFHGNLVQESKTAVPLVAVVTAPIRGEPRCL